MNKKSYGSATIILGGYVFCFEVFFYPFLGEFISVNMSRLLLMNVPTSLGVVLSVFLMGVGVYVLRNGEVDE